MSEHAPSGTDSAPWAPPPAPPSGGGTSGHSNGRWNGRSKLKLAVAAAVAGVVAAGGGVAVANAASTGGAVTQEYLHAPGVYAGAGGAQRDAAAGWHHHGQAQQGRSKPLHGDFVVQDPSGNYVTHRLQSGTVTAVSPTSITAKSADGHSTTFTVDNSTKVDHGRASISNVQVGQNVMIVGVVSGNTATAKAIFDANLRTQHAPQPGQSAPQPSPTQ